MEIPAARREGRGNQLLVGILIGALIGGVAGGLVADRSFDLPSPSFTTTPTPGGLPTPTRGGTVAPDTDPVEEAVRALGPAVVTVVQKAAGRDVGSGSGFVVDASRGYIITNSHVVTDQLGQAGAAFDVIFSSERTVSARLVGRDPDTDVAVLQVEASGLVAAALGNSDEVPVGARVLAIGSALGAFRNSVTSGVLSAKGRRLESDQTRGIFLEDLLQTDSPISPGNSGGPLIWAARKQVIGVNTLVIREPGSEALGFAVSSNTARQIADELIRSGRIERGRVGIGYQQLTPRVAVTLGLPANTSGIVITQVLAGSPGAGVGLRQNDVITAVNDQAIDNEHPLGTIMLKFRAGDRVRLTVFREGRQQTVDVTLGR